MYHVPVLYKESLEALNITPSGVYVDATFGGGGHSRGIVEQLKSGRLFSVDADADAEKNSLDFIEKYPDNFTFIRQFYSYTNFFLDYYGHPQVDGVLADLGVSWHQFDDENRGFSFRFDTELDMRMNQQAEKSAKTVVNEYTRDQLTDIFREYGELKHAGGLSAALVRSRAAAPIQTAGQLMEASEDYIRAMIPKKKRKEKENQMYARIFQALRIEVNDELEHLKRFLEQTTEIVKPGGRLAVITYHSLEDRLVKNFIKTGNVEGNEEKDFYGNIVRPFDAVNRKVIVPTETEIEQNNRARSAKLRIAERREA